MQQQRGTSHFTPYLVRLNSHPSILLQPSRQCISWLLGLPMMSFQQRLPNELLLEILAYLNDGKIAIKSEAGVSLSKYLLPRPKFIGCDARRRLYDDWLIQCDSSLMRLLHCCLRTWSYIWDSGTFKTQTGIQSPGNHKQSLY